MLSSQSSHNSELLPVLLLRSLITHSIFRLPDRVEHSCQYDEQELAALPEYSVADQVHRLCWLLVVSCGQNWPVRTSHHDSCSLPIPQRKSTFESIQSLISYQKQVRTCRRKRTPPKASDHPAATGGTTCLYQNGSEAPGAAGQDGSKLEASAYHSFSQRRYYGGIVRDSSCIGNTSPEHLLPNQRSPQRLSP